MSNSQQSLNHIMPTRSNVVLVNAGKKVRVIAQCVKFKDGKKVTTRPISRIIHIYKSVNVLVIFVPYDTVC